MANKTQASAPEDDQFTMIRVRKSTRNSLKKLCPKKEKMQFFASDFIDGAIEHREVLSGVLAHSDK